MKRSTDTEFGRAFNEIVARIDRSLRDAPPGMLPVRMYVAGGAALHILTGERVTEDIDATFSRRLIVNENLETAYRDTDGRARLLYLDRNYNDTLGLLHENAYEDSEPVEVPGVDAGVVEVRILTPTDLAVSKLARFSDQDREDIRCLARRGLIESSSLRRRAEEALRNYVGDTQPVRTSIDVACRLADAERPARPGGTKKKKSMRKKMR